MNLTEFLIIYLSIGAPFGVYYFLNNLPRNFEFSFLLKTVGVALFWCFYAFSLISRNSTKFTAAQTFSDSNDSANATEQTTRKLLAVYSEIPASDRFVPFFEFRETIERYVGLTSAARDSAQASEFQNELFTVAGLQDRDLQLANCCLQRRNLLRLKAHQRQAQKDFLHIFENSFAKNFEPKTCENLFAAAVHLTESLADAETGAALRRIKNEIQRQNLSVAASVKMEKEQWNNSSTEQIHVLPTQSSTLIPAMKTQD